MRPQYRVRTNACSPGRSGTWGKGVIETRPNETGLIETRPNETGPIETGPIETGPNETGPNETGLIEMVEW